MEIYNEFTIDDNEDKLKKEITQKTMIKNNNNELKLKPKIKVETKTIIIILIMKMVE